MADPYARNMFGQFNPYFKKRSVTGKIVVVLDGSFEDRGLQLMKPSSRALRNTEIHELIISDEQISPGDKVNKIAYIGFVEIDVGGVVIHGDPVIINGKHIGNIAGFDETHMPNHINIVLQGERIPGKNHQLELENDVTIG